MLLEVEKAIAKQKFSDQDELEDKLDQDISEEVNLEEKQRIDEIVRRETARMKMTYNKENKSLDPGNLKATEFKFNRHINLPGGSAPEKEALFEIRRQQAVETFNKFSSTVAENKTKNRMKESCKK